VLEMTMKLDKLDKSRYSTHSKNYNYADDSLLHDIHFSSGDRPAAGTALLI
jgi:hypothetical protein